MRWDRWRAYERRIERRAGRPFTAVGTATGAGMAWLGASRAVLGGHTIMRHARARRGTPRPRRAGCFRAGHSRTAQVAEKRSRAGIRRALREPGVTGTVVARTAGDRRRGDSRAARCAQRGIRWAISDAAMDHVDSVPATGRKRMHELAAAFWGNVRQDALPSRPEAASNGQE
jgi:hypothetical protein